MLKEIECFRQTCKIQKNGVITLPKDMLENMNLKTGDDIEISYLLGVRYSLCDYSRRTSPQHYIAQYYDETGTIYRK